MIGTVFDIKEFSLHDGPGARVTVFFKGCPLRCLWCHNPEGLEMTPQIMIKNNLCTYCGRCREKCEHHECKPFDRCVHACPNGLISISGRKMTSVELRRVIEKDAFFYETNNGGVTFSGGEPLLQSEFILETCNGLNMHKAIQTSGYANPEIFKSVINVMDFVMMDIKIADREVHKQYTGVYNDLILENFEYLKNSGKNFVIRTPLVPYITDTEQNLTAIEKITKGYNWEKLAYNEMAGVKYQMLGMEYKMDKKLEEREYKL